MITKEELGLMEQIERLEPKVYIDLGLLVDDAQALQYIKDRDELARLQHELGKISSFKYSRVDFGPGGLWVQSGNQTVYEAEHQCDECGTFTTSFLSEWERDQYIETRNRHSTELYVPTDHVITQIVRKTPS